MKLKIQNQPVFHIVPTTCSQPQEKKHLSSVCLTWFYSINQKLSQENYSYVSIGTPFNEYNYAHVIPKCCYGVKEKTNKISTLPSKNNINDTITHTQTFISHGTCIKINEWEGKKVVSWMIENNIVGSLVVLFSTILFVCKFLHVWLIRHHQDSVCTQKNWIYSILSTLH